MRMAEAHADLEAARQLVAPLPLEEYHNECGKFLPFIEHSAGVICRRVAEMTRQPAFKTMAMHEIERAEQSLERALATLREAKVSFNQKPQEAF